MSGWISSKRSSWPIDCRRLKMSCVEAREPGHRGSDLRTPRLLPPTVLTCQGPLAQQRDSRQRGVVAVLVNHHEIVADGTGCNQTVDAGTDSEPGATGAAVDVGSVSGTTPFAPPLSK